MVLASARQASSTLKKCRAGPLTASVIAAAVIGPVSCDYKPVCALHPVSPGFVTLVFVPGIFAAA